MRYLRLAGLITLLAIGLLTQKSYAIDPPHDVVDCTACHSTGKVSAAKQGLELSSMCLDCHRPGYRGSVINPKPANPYGTANAIVPKGTGTEHAFMGYDLNVQAKATTRPSDPAYFGQYGTYVTGQLSCISCHNPHVQPTSSGKFLRAPMTNDELCLVCHSTMDKQNASTGFTHPVKVAMPGNSANYFATPQYTSLGVQYKAKNDKVTCTVCHKPHNAFSNPTATKGKGDGYLGRAYMNEWLCAQCHRKQVHGGSKHTSSNISTCQDCHNTHNPGGNVKLVSNSIKNPRTGQNVAVSYNGSNFIINSGEQGIGICQVCHVSTNYFRNYSTTAYTVNAAVKGHPTDSTSACLSCHQHSESTGAAPAVGANITEKGAFTPSGCNTCHGSGSNYWPTGNVYPNYSGSHRRHTASLGCSVCHNNPGGSNHYETPEYIPPADVNFKKPNGSGGWTNDVAYDYDNKDCSNAYCHGSTLTGRSITQWRWTDNPALDCGSCHGFPPSGDKHTAHIMSLPESYRNTTTKIANICSACHPGANAYTTGFAGNHGDGNIDIAGAVYVTSYNGADKTCVNSCHGSTTADGAWTDANGLDCDKCHGSAGGKAYPATGKHAKHEPGVLNGITECASCHAAYTDGYTSKAYPALAHNIVGGSPADGKAALYDKATAANTEVAVSDAGFNAPSNANTFSNATPTCSNTKCHDPSQDGHSANWYTTTANCGTCHNDTTAWPATKSHTAHKNAYTTYGKVIACTDCHPSGSYNNAHRTGTINFTGLTYTDGDGSVIPSTTDGTCGTNACHNDGKGGVAQNPAWGTTQSGCNFCHNSTTITTGSHGGHSNSTYGPGITYSDVSGCIQCHTAATSSYHINSTVTFRDNNIKAATTACNNCHTPANAGTAKSNWDSSTSLGCTTCHNATPANSKFDGSGMSAPNFPNFANTGHGKTSGTYATSNNPAANKGCLDCHGQTTWTGGTTHISNTADDFMRLKSTISSGGTALEACNTCHASGSAFSTTTGIVGHKVGNAAYTRKGTPPFTVDCRICHDVHGTSNIQMVKATTDSGWYNGAVTFSARTGAGSFDENDLGVSGGNNNDICATCHQDPAHNNRANLSTPTHNEGSNCMDCHSHKGGFAATGCAGCHGVSATGQVWPAGTTFPNYSGSHRKHIAFADNCVICHDNPGGSGHNNGSPAEVSIMKPYTSGGMVLYKADTTASYDSAEPFTCTNTYCHVGTTMTWKSNPTMTCGSCHGFPPSGGLHANHYANGNADLTECDQCHTGASSYATAFSGTHGNGVIEVGGARVSGYDGAKNCTTSCHTTAKWTDATLSCNACHDNPPTTNKHTAHTGLSIACGACHYNINTTPHANMTHNDATGSNDGDTLYKRAKGFDNAVNPGRVTEVDDRQYNDGVNSTWNGTNKTCATAQCHNPSPSGTKKADWDAGETANCTYCHETNSISTGAHAAHLSANTKFGIIVTCTMCHPNNTGSNTHFLNSGVPAGTVSFTGASVSFTYTGDKTIPITTLSGTCGTNTCHNNGKGGVPVSDIAWNATTDNNNESVSCNICHAFPYNADRHAAHSNSAYGPGMNFSSSTTCGQCHTAANTSSHINTAKNFRDGGNTLGASTSCDNCHTSASAASAKAEWTTSNMLACDSCHASTPANSKYDGSGVNAPYKQYALSVGHGKTTGSYSSGNPAANTNCAGCHEAAPSSGTHIDHSAGSNYTRLTAANNNAFCTACHTAMDTHGNQGGFTSKATERAFSLACTTCHDVHGTTNWEMIRTNIQGRYTGALEGAVTFTARTGANSFAASGATASAVCVTCHQGDKDNAAAFTSAGSHVGGVHSTGDFSGLNCIDCHKHNYDATNNNSDGFMASCTDCHGVPATGQVWPSGTTFPNYSGSHRQHIAFNSNCAICHNNPGGPGHNNGSPAEVSIMKPYTSGGMVLYKADTGASYNSAEPYTCSTTYCHAGTTMTWKSTPTMTCGSCHGFPPSGIHALHISADVIARGSVAGACALCHPSSAYTTGFATTHGNGAIEIGGSDVSAYSKTDKTCTNTCHASTVSDGAWTDANGLNCNSCHNTQNNAIHGKHTALSGIECISCHVNYPKATDGYTSKSDMTHNIIGGAPANAAAALRDKAQALSTEAVVNDSAFNAPSNANTFSNATPTCSNTKCHNPSQDGHSANWYTTTADCGTCHNNTTTWPNTKSHPAHKNAAAVYGKTMACTSCHPSGSYNNAHRAGTVNFVGGLTYTDTDGSVIPSTTDGTCGTNACHNDGKGGSPAQNPAWGTAIANTPQSTACSFCHTLPPATSAHTAHIASGTSTADYTTDANLSDTNNYRFNCGNCHPLTLTNHINGTRNIELYNIGATGFKANNPETATFSGSGAAMTCNNIYCHSSGADGANRAYKQTPQWGANYSANKCGQCHDNPPQYEGQGHYTNNGFMGKEGGHLIGIHFDNIYTGNNNLATAGSTNTSSHGHAGTSTTISCNTCHDGIVSSATIDTYALTGVTSSMKCANCHPAGSVPLQNGAIANKALHVNGSKNVAFANVQVKSKAQIQQASFKSYSGIWQRVSGYKAAGSYDQSKASLNTSTWNSGTKSCTTACHNNKPVTWGSTSVTCLSCHTGL